MKPKKIIFFGLFGQQNIGNDCTLQAILYKARKHLPDAEIGCICTCPEEISARYNIHTFPMMIMSGQVRHGRTNMLMKILRKFFIRIPLEIFHWIKAFKTLGDTHMLIMPGTGLLVDHSTGPFGFPYYVFKWSILAKLRRCKLLIVSMGGGPIYQLLSRRFIRFALSLADYRSYRDTFSKQYLQSIGAEINGDPVYPDLAFSLPGDIMTGCDNRGGQRPVVGVGVVDYHGHSGNPRRGGEAVYREYLNKMVSFVAWLLEYKYTVRVLIGDVRYDSSVRQDLLELIEKRGLKYEEGQIISEKISSVEQLLPQLAGTDVVVSPRFHNIILALMLNKPVIALSHDKKFDSLMAGVGLSEYCHQIDHLDVDKLIEQFIKIEKNSKNLKPHIRNKIEENRKALDEQYNLIFNNV